MPDVTQLLHAVESGEAKAADQLMPLIYDELRRVAAAKMAKEAPGQTLQATALVHEAYLRLISGEPPRFKDRQHFYHTAAEVMRRILVDRARRKLASKRGAKAEHIEWDAVEIADDQDDDWVIGVHEALDDLNQLDPEKAEIVKLRFFVGLSNAEAAALLGISEKTVQRYWGFCKAWLIDRIKQG